MKNLSSRFSKVRQKITKDPQLAIALLNDLQQDIMEKFSSKTRAYDTLMSARTAQNSEILAVRDFSEVDVVITDSSTSKLTLSPSEKRCTLKVSKNCSEQVTSELIKITNYIRMQPTYCKTVRGRFHFSKSRDCYEIALITDTKHYKPLSFSFSKEQLENF